MNFIILFLSLLWVVAAEPRLQTRELAHRDHCHDDGECNSGLECNWVNGIKCCVYKDSRRRRRRGDRRRGDQRGTGRLIGDHCRNDNQCPDGATCFDRHCEWRRGRRGDRGDDCDRDSDCRIGLECRKGCCSPF